MCLFGRGLLFSINGYEVDVAFCGVFVVCGGGVCGWGIGDEGEAG
jgi:hypothetical protein